VLIKKVFFTFEFQNKLPFDLIMFTCYSELKRRLKAEQKAKEKAEKAQAKEKEKEATGAPSDKKKDLAAEEEISPNVSILMWT
jgi:choline-glycine betaine transporter